MAETDYWGEFDAELLRAAEHVAEVLRERDLKVVFAESCTAGLVSATLSRIPGISAHLCGSMATYREETKHQWLGISRQHFVQPGVVSERVAREMAYGVLQRTPEADVALSVTGYLGPGAPAEQDGEVHVGLASRHDAGPAASTSIAVRWQGELADLFGPAPRLSLRERRQWATVRFLLARAAEFALHYDM